MNEALKVELHLQRAMPFLEGKHRSPVEPEVRVEDILAEYFIDSLIVELFGKRKNEFDNLLAPFCSKREVHSGLGILTSLDCGSLQRTVWIVLIEPVKLIEHRS